MINLLLYDIIIINSSAGKDSLCSIFEVCRIAKIQNYPIKKIVVSHQDLGEMEWSGTKELAKKQAELFDLKIYYSKRRDKNGDEESLLQYVDRWGKWPSSKQRYCTSDFKRTPGGRIVTYLTRNLGNCKVLHVFGFRKEESPSRSNKRKYSFNSRLSTNTRRVYDWLPIHGWSVKKVWDTIHKHSLPYHPAYDLGMPRLSCCFCIFSPFDALVIAGKHNYQLLEKYVEVEDRIGHSFKNGFKIMEVKNAIDNGYYPTNVKDWIM